MSEPSRSPHLYEQTAATTVPGYDSVQQLVALLVANGAPSKPRVLDLGCGPGNGIIAMAARLPEARFVGCDPNAALVGLARERTEASGISASLVHGGVEALGPDTPPFDVVVSTLVIAFIPPALRGEWMRAIRDRLDRGGRLILTTMVRASKQEMDVWGRARALFAASNGVPAEVLQQRMESLGSTEALPPTEAEVLALLEQAGFTNVVRVAQCLAVHSWMARAQTP